MGYKMKRGAAPKFKDLGSSPTVGDSPNKFINPFMAFGMAKRKNPDEEKYKDEIEKAGLQRTFLGSIFGHKKEERERLITELQARDREEVDAKRIKSRTMGSTDPMLA